MTINQENVLPPSSGQKRSKGPLSKLWREVSRPFRPKRVVVIKKVYVKPEQMKPKIPAMITEREADFFARCAEISSPLAGSIVDLGCWMGSTAIALANGSLRAGGHDRVTAFDIFIWEDWMNESHAKLVQGIYRHGESFLPEARRMVHEHGHGLVDLVAADLQAYEWSGEPIKLLLVDAMKSMSLMRQIATTFFPCVPAKGLVLHQDFKHCYTSWIHLLHYRLRNHFELVESVIPGGTVGFRVVKPMTAGDVAAAIQFEGMCEAEIDAAFAYSLSLLDPADRNEVAGAHLALYCREKKVEKVRELVKHYFKSGIDAASEFPPAIQLLQDATPLGANIRPIRAA